MKEENKKGKVKEWLREYWPILVYGGCWAAMIGGSVYATHKAKKETERLNAYWQTPEAWRSQAEEYKLLTQQCELMGDYYATGAAPTDDAFNIIKKGEN